VERHLLEVKILEDIMVVWHIDEGHGMLRINDEWINVTYTKYYPIFTVKLSCEPLPPAMVGAWAVGAAAATPWGPARPDGTSQQQQKRTKRGGPRDNISDGSTRILNTKLCRDSAYGRFIIQSFSLRFFIFKLIQ
jgi:hypothetical protein